MKSLAIIPALVGAGIVLATSTSLLPVAGLLLIALSYWMAHFHNMGNKAKVEWVPDCKYRIISGHGIKLFVWSEDEGLCSNDRAVVIVTNRLNAS